MAGSGMVSVHTDLEADKGVQGSGFCFPMFYTLCLWQFGNTGQEELGFWGILRAGACGKGTVWYCVVLLSKHSSTKGVFECQPWLWVSLTVSNSIYPANSLRKEFYLAWKVMSALLSY